MMLRRILLSAAAVAVLFSIAGGALSIWQALNDTTVYAPGYSEQLFQSIRLGMSENDVIQLLGKPLEDKTNKGYVNWYYGPRTLEVARDGSVHGGTFTYIQADASGKVDATAGDFLKASWQELIGQDLANIRSRFGEPVAIVPHDTWRYLAFSATRVSGSYFIRRVWLDEAGRVKQIEANWYQD